MAETPATERLQWVGPDGHTSPICGPLETGRFYDIPADHVAYFLTQKGFWARPAKPAPARAKAEKE